MTGAIRGGSHYTGKLSRFGYITIREKKHLCADEENDVQNEAWNETRCSVGKKVSQYVQQPEVIIFFQKEFLYLEYNWRKL